MQCLAGLTAGPARGGSVVWPRYEIHRSDRGRRERTLRVALLVGFVVTLARAVHAPVVALHGVLVVDVGTFRRHARQLHPFPSATWLTITEATTSSTRSVRNPRRRRAPTPASDRIATAVSADARRPVRQGGGGFAPDPLGDICYGND